MIEIRRWPLREKIICVFLAFAWFLLWSNFILTLVIQVNNDGGVAMFLFTTFISTTWFLTKFISLFVGWWGVLELCQWLYQRRVN